ncbi:MAG: hypothetical protein QN210_03910 [Armatimonadota bacterium]|nr:hypothetical protein [Armatimonadota bacterium]MDR7611546.1 hypothetical protein [Armatimonadota bacterium]
MRRWVVGCATLLAGALLVEWGLTQPVRVGYAPTEANSQRKVVAAEQVLITYTAAVSGVPAVLLDEVGPDGSRRTVLRVSEGPGPATLSTLVTGPGGGLHVAWTEFTGSLGRVHYRRRAAGAWTPPAAVSPSGAYAGYPSLDVDSTGRVHLAWYGIRQSAGGRPVAHGGIYEIFYTQLRGGAWTVPEVLSPGVPDSLNPALAVDAAGRVHVVWFQSDGRAYQVVYRMRAQDGAWTPPGYLTDGEAPSTRPALAVDGAGTVHVVWEHRDGIWYRSGRSGRWDRVVQIAPRGRRPAVGVVGASVFVAWSDGQAVWLRVRTRGWRPAARLGTGDHPSVFPWRAGQASRPWAVWTVGAQVRAEDLSVLVGRR